MCEKRERHEPGCKAKVTIEAVRERKTVSELAIQFTSEAFTGRLEAAGIAISMDRRTLALENMFIERLWRNLKCEDIYLKGYATADGLTEGLRVATFRHDASSLQGLHPDRSGEYLLR